MTKKEINYQIEATEFHIQELEREIEKHKKDLLIRFDYTY
jgi:hypothetical protein